MTNRATTDPADELFDVLDQSGRPTGEVKRRADIHRDGDWHRAFHLWVFAGSGEGDGRVLFQRRASRKDTWPDHLDVAVGGHYRAGETFEDVVREIEEEIGIQPQLSQLVYAGQRRATSLRPEWHDRELQDVYLLAYPREFPAFAPYGTELAALVQLEIVDLIQLFSEEREHAPALVAPVVSDRVLGGWNETSISRTDFGPVRDDYWLRGALCGRALLAGSGTVSIHGVCGDSGTTFRA